MGLNHKNIIITGASSGIGLALLNELKKYQCRILAAARSIDKIDIKENKNSIFPSKIFLSLLILNRFIPVLFPLIVFIEKIKFDRWLKRKAAGEK